MSLSPFNFDAQTVKDLQTWFVDIFNHLGSENWDENIWEPNITIVGSPNISGWYWRIGTMVSITISVDGTSQTSSSVIDNLPFISLDWGIITCMNITDNSLIGHGYIDKSSTDLYLPDWNVTSKNIIIQGNYKITGI